MFTGYSQSENQGFKLFSNYYWELVLDFVESNKNNYELNEIFRRFYLVGLKAISPNLKDRIMTILNDFNYNSFMGKFNIILNPDYKNSFLLSQKNSYAYGSGQNMSNPTVFQSQAQNQQELKIDFVKKLCL